MTRAIVYLDTQDYSRLADAVAGRGQADLLPVYDQLRKFAREGVVEFCFSYMIVSELLQLNPSDIEIARRKASVVEELCGAHAFPNIFWLLSADLTAAARGRGIATKASPNLEKIVFGGQWIRTELADLEEMFVAFDERVASAANSEMTTALGRVPNRKDRRRFAKPHSIEIAQRIVAESPFYPVIKGTPLQGKFVDALRRKKMPEVAEDFFRFLALPTRLVLSHDYVHSMTFLNIQLDTLKEAMFVGMARLRDEFDSVRRARGVPISRSQREEMLKQPLEEHLVSLTRKLKAHLVRYGVPTEYFDHPQFNDDVARLPFLSTWRDLMTPYLLMVTEEEAMRRTLQRSDIVDLMHAMYAPHCAVWRSDRYFAGLATPVARALGCRVVSRLADLPLMLASMPSR